MPKVKDLTQLELNIVYGVTVPFLLVLTAILCHLTLVCIKHLLRKCWRAWLTLKGRIDARKNIDIEMWGESHSECSICYEKLFEEKENEDEKRKVIKIRCKHRFHADCLKTWLNVKTDCPLCRSQIDEFECSFIQSV